MSNISVVSVNISEKRGTIKIPKESITLTTNGIENDAHAGDWHRQISILGEESVRKFESTAGRKINYGEFAENITTKGIVLFKTTPGDIFNIGDAVLEVTQIGKEYHGDNSGMFSEIGSAMPKEGIFCKVIEGGVIKPGDSITYLKKSS
ncbi:MAG: MOSC domain-containing protein [Salinivirgaceae bacterium]|nr:MOSC domain-containing protein [Salinivirgaceae bacterium]